MQLDVQIGNIQEDTGFVKIGLNHELGHLCSLNINYRELVSMYNGQNTITPDLILFTSVIYIVDKMISRENHASDCWTRDLNLQIPVNNPLLWESINQKLVSCLSFLTGDNWTLSFRQHTGEICQSREEEGDYTHKHYGAVSLFSGGLDSLIGVIDYLENNPENNLLLVGHYDPHVSGPKSDQNSVFNNLKNTYGDRVDFFQIKVGQDQSGDETTFRSRSLLFLGLGIFAANNVSPDTPLLIPENGVISLNPPLTPSRRGSCSTRTTHPYFIKSFQDVLVGLGVNNAIDNPLKYKTKGEALGNCKNRYLIEKIAPLTVSCGKRGHTRNWENRNAKGCGVCIPCIYRRASMHKLEWDNEMYGIDFCSNQFVLDSNLQTPADLRAYTSFIKKGYSNMEIARLLVASGKIPDDELLIYSHLVVRSVEEVKKLISDKGNDVLKEKSGIIGR